MKNSVGYMIDILAALDGSSIDNLVNKSAISEEVGFKQDYIGQLLMLLRKAGLIGSKRGVGGGFFLKVPLSCITVGNIIELSSPRYKSDTVRFLSGSVMDSVGGLLISDLLFMMKEEK